MDLLSVMPVVSMKNCTVQTGHWKWEKTTFRKEKENNLHKEGEREAKLKSNVRLSYLLVSLIRLFKRRKHKPIHVPLDVQTQGKQKPGPVPSSITPVSGRKSESLLTKTQKPFMQFDKEWRREEKVFITDAEAQVGIPPQEISLGMRSYSCSSEECKNLHFSSFEGPNSVKEHIAIHHRKKI